MKKTIGIVAHVDAGKTTFAEQLLYHTNSIRQRGRVDHKNAFLDSHDIEKERGITIFSDQAIMSYKGCQYYLIDTPGHVDFSPEMERSIQVMDYAIVIISAVEGVQGHTETVWNLLRKHQIPTFFFINKVDRLGADADGVIEDIRLHMTEDVCDITEAFSEGKLKEPLIEFTAERDEELLEKYLEGAYEESLWINTLKLLVKRNKAFPCCRGSALQDTGVIEFFDKLDRLTSAEYYPKGAFSGRVYKIRYDSSGTRVTFIKGLTGSLKVRDEVGYDNGLNRTYEKVTQIRLYNGAKYKVVDQVTAGELFGVIGLTAAAAGQGLGDLKERVLYEMIPTLKAKVLFDPDLNVKEVLKSFKILEEEDPSLNVTWEESLQEIDIHVMGTIQLEVLEQLVKERFGFTVRFDKPEILYKETIAAPVTACAHFEPLGHYAEVHLRMEPGERNSGITFTNACHPDDLSTNYQNLIIQHIYERAHHGLLTGSPVTDIKITLLTGRSHIKHTTGGDFREATYRAIRQGLEKAENILLEPYYDFRIKVDLDHIGRVLSDIQNSHGSFMPPKITADKAEISGKIPAAAFMNYSVELAAYSQGKGSINLSFGGYHRCHNEEAVIANKGYNKNADPRYTSSSIFCSKGQSYSVPWNEAESKMHC